MLTFDFNKINLMDNSGKMLDVGCGAVSYTHLDAADE